ncbi:MAG TPA: RsmE family RNA methyltransferase [Tepidisphaeraceae bacterium]|nr:RsmE family RNA methyltransferase [Tepidisphaeraceae bacterium]
MLRRLHVPQLASGRIDLPPAQAHHARDVLRLSSGDRVELFDDTGAVATAAITDCDASGVSVLVESADLSAAPPEKPKIIIASAIPKSTRADWMIEKLSELGVDRFIPLAAERSVVVPEGKQKIARWSRLAAEAARQSRRRGALKINPVTTIADLLDQAPSLCTKACCLSPESQTPIADFLASAPTSLLMIVGPEGGWTDAETAMFDNASLAPVRLTDTILRIETAAVVAAAIAAVLNSERSRPA